jgi:RNA polymerase sigma-70 factor (ECF subfamily)
MTLDAVYLRYSQSLFTLALSRTGHREQAEDAVHDAFARLCSSDWQRAADPIAYVFAAVRNAALDRVRRAHATGSNGKLCESIFDPESPAPDARIAWVELCETLGAAVADLGTDQREALVLKIYAGFTFAQISQVVGAPIPTISARYQRALDQLRLRLEKLV